MVFLIFIFGLLIGSFLNVCIYRIPNDESIAFPPSHCSSCEHPLSPRDLIPILSYLTLKGKCRYCNQVIAKRYPMIEALNAILYVLAYLKFGYQIESLIGFVFISWTIVITFIDIDHMIIPNSLVIFGILCAIGILVYDYLFGYDVYMGQAWYQGILGMFAGTAVYLAIAIISIFIYGEDGGLGMGDVKFMFPLGAFLGWQLALLTVWLSFIIGGIIGVMLLFVFKKDRKMAMPFGPFIVLGGYISMFFGEKLIHLWLG